MFRSELQKHSGDVTVFINSPGGDVFAASQIYTMLRNHPGKVTVKIDGIAASAASVVAMAGEETLISPTGMLMCHNPMTCAMGNKADMEKAIALLDEVKESIINAYVRKTGQSRAKLSHLMDAETWMDANKAVELGFADDILFQKEEQGDEGENGDPGADRTENGTSDSVMFSRRAVNNALMNKLERHYGKTGKSVKDQTGISEPKVNSVDTGRSADDLRERLNFIKKYI